MKSISIKEAEKVFEDLGLKLIDKDEPIPDGYIVAKYSVGDMMDDFSMSQMISISYNNVIKKSSSLLFTNESACLFAA